MNPTSSNYWLPLIERAGLPVPRTIVVPYDHRAMLLSLEDEDWGVILKYVAEAVSEIGNTAFLRTDMGSAKHDGPAAYRIDRGEPAEVRRVLGRLIEDQEMKFWLEPEGTPTSLLVREWLNLDAPFAAFGFGGDPPHAIAREWRVFASSRSADEADVDCWHFYWPAHAIEDYRPTADNWRELLAEMDSAPMPDLLFGLAAQAAMACHELAPAWSIDFAQDVHGKWWLIDMAEAHKSWHPDHEEAADAAL